MAPWRLASLWTVILSLWVRAYRVAKADLAFERPLRRSVLVIGVGAALALLLDVILPNVAVSQSLRQGAALLLSAVPSAFAVSLLAWPRREEAKVSSGYLTVDLATIGLAIGLLVWWVQRANGHALNLESLISVSVAALTIASLSFAVLRGPSDRYAAPFMLSLLWMLVYFTANSVLALFSEFQGSDESGWASLFVQALTVVMIGLGAASAEVLRLGWRWPGRRAALDDTSPVPWVAVSLIAVFVLKLGFEQIESGIGVVLIGAVVTMGLLVVRQAITMRHNERLQAERATLEADARIAAMVRHTSDVILILDERQVVRYASPSAEALWDRAESALVGTSISSLVDQSSQADVARMLDDRMAQPGQTESSRWRIPAPEGAARRVEAVAISLLHEPSVRGIVVTLRDQTERIQLEEQLSQSQKMEAIGQLAGGVAHDFNNLLTTILGHAEVGLDVLSETHEVRDDLVQIKRASELAASLTRQLLAFSRKQVIEPKVIEVGQPIEQVSRMLRRLIKEHVTTVLEIAPNLPPIKADPYQVEQVVLNLAVNARDAMPKGGRLVIRARVETVTAAITDAVLPVPLGECVVVEVADNGTGMDPATQARIFEPFFTTKGAGRGTGLGLATVYGIIKHSGAGLLVRSTVGKGSTFSVYFPRVNERPELASLPDSQARQLPAFAATILLVEDESALREIAHKVLAREGYRVLVAADAEDAMTLAASAPFPIDLLLSDVVMPGMNGATLARELTSTRPGLRVLLMSGYAGDDLTGELRPGERFLRKPFTPYVLLENVRVALAGLVDPAAPGLDR